MPLFHRHDLADGAFLLYAPAFLDAAEADALLARLVAEAPWAQEHGLFGRPLPRLTAYFADAGVSYTYSGLTHPAVPWPDHLLALRRRVEDAAGAPFNSLLLNYYRTGGDSIGYHTDAEPELGVNPIVPSLSLGAARRFHLRHMHTGQRHTLELPHGSLLIMAGTTQHHYKHAVPKTNQPVGARVNLTFRHILPQP